MDRLPNGTRVIGRPSTGFLLKSGYLVTARHVVQNYELADILGVSVYNDRITFTEIVSDGPGSSDIAILKPADHPGGGLELGDDDRLCIGEQVATLGFPWLGEHRGGENGRTMPLLSMGFLSGYDDFTDDDRPIKYYVINGGVTIGNSGSPVFRFRDEKVVGMVVRKFAPFTSDIAPELAAQDPELVESLFNAYNIVTPSMMFRAICASELKHLLLRKNIPL